jgi:hypothetical protein
MYIVLVGRSFSLEQWLATLPLLSALYGVVNSTCSLWCAAARLAGNGVVVAPIDSEILFTTPW